MKLEDATKEELIYWIKLHEFNLASELNRFERDILLYRMQKSSERHNKLVAMYSKTYSAYIELLEPYNSIMDIPKDVLNEGVKLEKEMKDLKNKSRKAQREWSKYNKKFDELL